jgi:hypothetical protein
MKNIIILFIIFLSNPIKAQKWLHAVSYGVKVGYTMSGVHRLIIGAVPNSQSGSNIYKGYELGTFLIYRPIKNWEIIGEVLYRRTGSFNYQRTGLEPGSLPFYGYIDIEDKFTFNSLIFPLSIGYRTTKWKVNPYINVGIVQSYIVSGYYKGNYNLNGVTQPSVDEHILLDSDKRPSIRKSLLRQGSIGIHIMEKWTFGFTITEGNNWVYPIFDRGTPLSQVAKGSAISEHEMSKSIFILYHIK